MTQEEKDRLEERIMMILRGGQREMVQLAAVIFIESFSEEEQEKIISTTIQDTKIAYSPFSHFMSIIYEKKVKSLNS